MKLVYRWLVPNLVALGALLLLYVRTNRLDFAEHQQFDSHLHSLRTLDATLNQDVLEARFRLLGDYDGFGGKLREMRRVVEALGTTPSFVAPAGQVAMRSKLAEFSRLLGEKEARLERFKSGNAVLNNSLQYLPVAGRDLLRELAADPASAALQTRMNELLQQVLLYGLNPGEDEAPALQDSLAQLRSWQAENPGSPHAAGISSVAAHARSILVHKPRIEALTQSIVSLATAPCAAEMLRLYELHFAEVLHAVERSRRVLTAGCVLLLFGVGGAGCALGFAKSDLERKVRVRTHELQNEVTERQLAEGAAVESKRFLQSALDALSAHIGILDATGRLIAVNGAWRHFAHANELAKGNDGVGENYLEICENASGDCSREATAVARGIRAVIAGETAEFHLEYPCHAPAEQRWFAVRVTRFPGHGPVHAVVAHENITARKLAQAEVEDMHRQLLEVSRAAGMAEVATNVLHNVGNVLNSANVSATLLAEAVKKSKAGDLARVVALLDRHADDLGAFVTGDAQGRALPAFLRQLSTQLAAERQSALAELDALRGNIEHIKEIVAMQQSYASVSGVAERLQVPDLVEDSLRMNAAALVRHEVAIERDYHEVAPVVLDKHKALQILVNLIRNAKHACDESGLAEKKITVRVAPSDGRIRITVADNGVGIPAENLTRIFNHGFTTRKEGHGFGLHSAALAAQDLGGLLVVQSDGPGRGATFTLELPVAANPRA